MRTAFLLAFAAAFPLVAAACGLDDGTVTIVGNPGPTAAKDGGPAIEDGGPVHSDAAPGEDGSVTIDGGGPADTSPPGAQPIVWATTATDLYSLEVTTGKLARTGALSGCATAIIDLGVDPAGELLSIVVEPNGDRDLADLTTAGACSNLRKFDSKNTTALAFEGIGAAASLFALRSNGRGLHLVARATGKDDEIASNLFEHNFDGDFACAADACYTVGAKVCSTPPAVGSSCIGKVTWDAAANYTYTELGTVMVPNVVGVAYHGSNVYLFSGSQPGVSVVNVTSLATVPLTLTGDPAPASWVGAGSTSAYL